MKQFGLILIAFVYGSVTVFSQDLEINKSILEEGQVVVDTVHSEALENNFLGDSPDRPVSIYLPPGYDSSPDKHYPVIYFLHSYGIDHTAFFGGYPWYSVDFKTICDDLISSGEIDPMIVVSPNAYNKYWGSFYTNSSVTGNWGDFIVEDLINYIDRNFRTLPQKESRGLAGHSMGGYGAMWLIMNNPSIFNEVYTLSGHPEFEGLYLDDNMIDAVNAPSLDGLGWRQVVCIALAAAIAPDSLAPPFYAQFPLNKDGVLIDSIWQIWLQSEPYAMLPSLKDSLLQLKAIQFDVGTNDSDAGFITGNRNFSQALNDLGIPHVFEEHNGNHSNKLSERIRTKLLPFFSAKLSRNMLTDTVFIPDVVFLNTLIEEGVDTNNDGQISYAEAAAVDSLDVVGNGISNMKGIEAFINLETLECSYNQLTSLDVSKNTALTHLFCEPNQLTNLDVTSNVNLLELSCGANQLTSLDVSNCGSLRSLDCEHNQLTSLDLKACSSLMILAVEDNDLKILDLSKNIVLEELDCGSTQLNNLDISNNIMLTLFRADYIPTLHEVCVWETFNKDSLVVQIAGSPNVYFTTECLYVDNVFIPDTAFLFALIDEGVDTDGDSLISYAEAEVVTALDVSGNWYYNDGNIINMTGIEAFVKLETLICGSNKFTSINVSGNTILKYLSIDDYYHDGKISALDLTNNTELEKLIIIGHKLTTLDLSNNKSLIYLDCAGNEIDTLNLSKNINLKTMICEGNELTSLDLSNNLALTGLFIGGPPEMRFPGTGLGPNPLSKLDISNCTALTRLHVGGFKSANIDVSSNTALEELKCWGSQLTTLDISNNTALEYLHCGGNQLTSLDVSNNTSLTYLNCRMNDSLQRVCVWENFPSGVEVHADDNVEFTTHCWPVGITMSKETKLSIFPNPTNNQLTIETANPEQHIIEIHSLNGQLIYSNKMDKPTLQIDLSYFQKGLYFITVRSRDFVWTEKILKL